MRMVSLLVMASMLAISLSSMGRPLLLQERGEIVRAVSAGSISGLTAVLSKHRLTVNAVISEDGWPLLYYAALLGTPDLVKYLIKNGAAVNHTDNNGNTPLDAAKFLRSEIPEMAALLEQAGASHGEDSLLMKTPDHINRLALNTIKKAVRENELDPSIDMRGDIFNLMRAGDINRLTAVLDKNGLMVSSVLNEEEGLTLLHYAIAMNGTPDVVKHLLENGAAVNPTDNQGNTPLDIAKFLRPELVALLEQAGARHGEDSHLMRIYGDNPYFKSKK